MSVPAIYKTCYLEAGKKIHEPWVIKRADTYEAVFEAAYSLALNHWCVTADPVDACGISLWFGGGSSAGDSANLSLVSMTCGLVGLGAGNRVLKWHRRLGHTSLSNLGQLSAGGMVKGLSISATEIKEAEGTACEPCILGKFHKVSSPSSDNVATAPLQRIVTDVYGPLPTSIDGHHYFVAARDEATGLAWAAPLAHKSGAFEELTSGVTKLETQSGVRLKILRSDNGGEFINKPLASWCKTKGIEHETTAPYSPEQNGRAERLGRTLFNYIRTIKISSGLPAERWPELLGAAVCVINRTPYRGLPGVPWGNFYGTAPNVSGMRPLGCRAYVLIPKERRGAASKLNPRGESGVLLGYEPGCKAYRILLDDGETVRVSKHVTFLESVMPLLAAAQSEDLGCAASDSESKDDAAPQPPAPAGGAAAGAGAGPAGSGAATGGGAGPAGSDAASAAPRAAAPQRAGETEAAAGGRPQRARRPVDRLTLLGLVAMGDSPADGDPRTHAEAMASEHAADWQEAEHTEMASHHRRGTWDLTPVYDVYGLPTNWVYKTKFRADGTIERRKARLVVLGNLQRAGIDFAETYAPSGRYTTIRVLLALVAQEGLHVAQMDVTTAFLNAELSPEDKIYIRLPAGYDDGTGAVYRLQRALYGLRQSPRYWHLLAVSTFKAMGAEQSARDPSLFVWRNGGGGGMAFAYMYVDDVIMACSDRATLTKLKARFLAEYEGRDLGTPTQFCGMAITLGPGYVRLGQRLLIEQMVSSFGLEAAAPCASPFAAGTELLPEGEPLDTQQHPYSSLVGVLLYIANSTRPDIAYACSTLAAQAARPTKAAWLAALRVARYLKGTAGYTLVYGRGSKELLVYSDADYAGDKGTRRSRSAFAQILGGGAVAWGSKLQKTVALSTAEAEVVALTIATKETIWLRAILSDLGYTSGPTKVYTDNQAALALANSGVISTRTKHIDVAYHFCKECIDAGTIQISYLGTNDMVADSLTKPVPHAKHEFCRKAMGLQ